jgi:hypothetical protein
VIVLEIPAVASAETIVRVAIVIVSDLKKEKK